MVTPRGISDGEAKVGVTCRFGQYSVNGIRSNRVRFVRGPLMGSREGSKVLYRDIVSEVFDCHRSFAIVAWEARESLNGPLPGGLLFQEAIHF
jgi:hypothetical protein